MKHLFTFVLVVLTSLFFTVGASALDSGTLPTKEVANPCIPYAHAMVAKGVPAWSHTIVLTHGDCNGQAPTVGHTTKAVESLDNATVVSFNDTVSHVAQDNHVVLGVEEDKPKCNNGEGNGSEGCSPAKSENANNDENQTTPKEDKSNK